MIGFLNFKKVGLTILMCMPFIGFSHNGSCCNNNRFIQPVKVFCDLCGCATNSSSFGFGTLNNTNFVGLRYIHQSFESKNGIFEDSPTSFEDISTYQLWAQIPIRKQFTMSANIPYQVLKREFQNETNQLDGIGDISLIGWYKHVFYKKEKSKSSEEIDYNKVKEPTGHSILFGLGAKLPTGKFEQRLANAVNPGFQVGTGSLDGVFSLGYNYGSDKFGLNTLVTYYLKTENKNDYQFGNQISINTKAFTAIKTSKMNIMPFVGFSYDNFDDIIQYEEVLKDTHGYVYNGSLGSEFVLKSFILGVNYSMPIQQNLFDNDVTSKARTSIYLNVAL